MNREASQNLHTIFKLSPTMKSIFTFCIFGFLVLFFAEGAFSQSKKQYLQEVETKIKKLDQAFERKMEDLAAKYAEEFEKIKQASIEKLEASQKLAMTAQNLDEAIKLRDIGIEIGGLKPDMPKSANKDQAALTAKFVGTSYEISINGKKRKWTLKPDGVVVCDGVPLKRWYAFKEDMVICIGFGEKKNVDVIDINLAGGGKTCEVKYIGNLSKPSVTHRGIIISSK